MKLLTILLFIVLLSNNYVMSQTRCPKNGIQTDDGACFYLSKEDCPLPWKDIGVIENDADYAIISDLLRETQTRERVCISIYDSDIKKILDRQPKYMKKLREENQILLNKPIQDDESLHIAFKIESRWLNSIIVIRDSLRNDIYFGKIEILDRKLHLSANTEIQTAPEVIDLKTNPNGFYEFDIRFIGNKLQVFDGSKHKKLIEIDLSLNSKYSADMISIDNIEVYQLEHHDIRCQSEVTYVTNNPVILKETDMNLRFERTIIENFNLNSNTVKHGMVLRKKSEWAENLVFHLIGHHNSSQFDLNVQFKNFKKTMNFEYKCSHGGLTYKYLSWVPVWLGGSDFVWKMMSEHLMSSSDGFTFNMFGSNQKMSIILESDGESLEHSINHPCWDGKIMQKGCKYEKASTIITSRSSYITGFRYLKKERLVKYCFSDYWIPEITTKVPYQSDCGTEKHLNICRIRRPVYSQSYQPLSSESSISDEQDEKLTKSTVFFKKEIVKPKSISIVTPCVWLVFCLILNLINIFECVQ